jgi:hypothetical protein
MSYGFASNLRDALPNVSFIGLTSSLPPLGRPAACASHSLSQSICSFGSRDLQEEAVKTVLAQAELLCAE